MSANESELKGWLKLTAAALARLVLYPAVLILLYALSQGPVVYYHNKNIGGGGAGYAPTMKVIYAPMQKIQRWIPFYREYMTWWCEP